MAHAWSLSLSLLSLSFSSLSLFLSHTHIHTQIMYISHTHSFTNSCSRTPVYLQCHTLHTHTHIHEQIVYLSLSYPCTYSIPTSSYTSCNISQQLNRTYSYFLYNAYLSSHVYTRLSFMYMYTSHPMCMHTSFPMRM
jgi:hypothetical protein